MSEHFSQSWGITVRADELMRFETWDAGSGTAARSRAKWLAEGFFEEIAAQMGDTFAMVDRRFASLGT
eukprot:3171267-Amphidinium_carterae.1